MQFPVRWKTTKAFQSTLPARGATRHTGNDQACVLFQSTLPARGATMDMMPHLLISCHFNPRSPRGERRAHLSLIDTVHFISIHAPREGSDKMFL